MLSRTIYNAFVGRTEFSTERDMDFERVRKALDGLATRTCLKGNISYRFFNKDGTVDQERSFNESTTPFEALNLFSATFKLSQIVLQHKPYFEGSCEIYSGERRQMYYIEIETGRLMKLPTVYGQAESFERKLRHKDSIEFLVRKP